MIDEEVNKHGSLLVCMRFFSLLYNCMRKLLHCDWLRAGLIQRRLFTIICGLLVTGLVPIM